MDSKRTHPRFEREDVCEHVFGPYFMHVPFKLYWLKCFKCGYRKGPWIRKQSVLDAHHESLGVTEDE